MNDTTGPVVDLTRSPHRRVWIKRVAGGWLVAVNVPTDANHRDEPAKWGPLEFTFPVDKQVDACQLAVKYMSTHPWTWMNGEPPRKGELEDAQGLEVNR